jgi:hypothetical protein
MASGFSTPLAVDRPKRLLALCRMNTWAWSMGKDPESFPIRASPTGTEVVATRKLGVPAEVARRKVDALSRLDVVVIRPELVLAAIDLHRLHSISFWDALVVRSAVAAGCARVMSEDLQDGQVIDGVRIENPFR